MIPDLRTLIGIPWEYQDCWQLVVRAHLQLFGVELPKYNADPMDRSLVARLIEEGKGGWTLLQPADARLGDVLLFREDRREPTHCGMVVDQERMLHVRRGQLSCIDWWSGPRALRWGRRLVEVRRR